MPNEDDFLVDVDDEVEETPFKARPQTTTPTNRPSFRAIGREALKKIENSEEGVPFPASLFGLPYEEYLEKEDWYQNVSWGIFMSVVMSALALIIAIF